MSPFFHTIIRKHPPMLLLPHLPGLGPGPVSVSLDQLVAQSCLTLCDPMDCSWPGSSVHGLLQAGVLEWFAIPLSRESS